MAYRDKDQPVAFIYTNLFDLLNKAKKKSTPTESQKPESLQSETMEDLKTNLTKLMFMRERLKSMLEMIEKIQKK